MYATILTNYSDNISEFMFGRTRAVLRYPLTDEFLAGT